MANIQLASFVGSEKDIFASLFALKSLSKLNLQMGKPIILMPRPLLEEFESQYPDLRLQPIYKKLGAQLELAFPKGYNWNLGFRPALSKIFDRAGEGAKVLYFSPRVIFFDREIFSQLEDQNWAAKQPDDFWPQSELYGPSLTEIWSRVVQMGGGEIDNWIDKDMPDEYWRRYPAASPALFYASDAQAFGEAYGAINDSLIAEIPKELEGQGHVPSEACLTATIVKLDGKIIDPSWDIAMQYYEDFYDLILRMSDGRWAWFVHEILETREVRSVMKSVEEYKIIFFQNRVLNTREKLDSIERNFSILRMQQLITRRKVRQKLQKKLKEMESLKLV